MTTYHLSKSEVTIGVLFFLTVTLLIKYVGSSFGVIVPYIDLLTSPWVTFGAYMLIWCMFFGKRIFQSPKKAAIILLAGIIVIYIVKIYYGV